MFWANALPKPSKEFLTQREKLITVSLLTKMTKSLSFKKTSLALAVALSLPVISAQAAESYKAEDVVVTASRVEQDLMDVNMAVSVITQEEIKKSGAQTIGDLLNMVPGVRVNPDGGQGMKRVKIRGEDSFRTLVMIDGQKISEQKSMSGSPMLIDPAMIERIEVIKGPASVLYGSDAIGGAVNIITKKGGSRPFEAEVSAGMNSSNNGTTASASLFGAYNGWRYRLGVAHENGDDLETPRGTMSPTDFNSLGANLFVAYDIDPNKEVGFTVDYFDMEFQSADVGMPAFFVDVPKWKRTKVGAFTELRAVNQYLQRLRVDAFYQNSDKSMHNHVEQDGMPLTIDPYADNDLDSYGLSLQTDWALGDNHYLIAGYEFNYDKLDAVSRTEAVVVSPQIPVMPNVGPYYTSTGYYQGTMQTHAIFAAMESTLPYDFKLNYGVRYTYVKTDMTKAEGFKDYHQGFFPDTTDGFGEEGKETNDRFVFNAGLSWSGIENWTLRAAWSQGFRTPLLQERYVPTAMGQMGTTWNNPDLKPETSDNFEIGARWMNGTSTLDASLFYSIADNYIDALPSAEHGGKDMYQNVAKAKTLGAEVSISTQILQTGFEPYASLTWMRRQYDYGNGVETYDSGTPSLSARYGIRWNGEYDSLDIHVDGYAWSQSATDYHSIDGESDYHLGGATTFNLTGGVAFGPQNKYSVDVGLYNITDKAYREQTSIWMPGRYFTVKLNAQF